MEATPLQLALGGAVVGALAWLFWPRKEPERKSYKSALLVGDSLGVGLEEPLRKALSPVPLAAKVHGGATARDWATGKYKGELQAALAARPDLVLISLGTNDTVPPPGELSLELPDNFKKIANLVRQNGGTPVFVILNLPWDNQRVHEAAALAGARLIENVGIARPPGDVHPTGTGYQTWAKLLAQELKLGSTLGHPIETFVI